MAVAGVFPDQFLDPLVAELMAERSHTVSWLKDQRSNMHFDRFVCLEFVSNKSKDHNSIDDDPPLYYCTVET